MSLTIQVFLFGFLLGLEHVAFSPGQSPSPSVCTPPPVSDAMMHVVATCEVHSFFCCFFS